MTQSHPTASEIERAIRTISSEHVKFIVNTHVHPDHIGGNEAFAKSGAVIFARDELRTRLMHGLDDAAGYRLPAPAGALPVVTSARRDARAPGGFGDYLANLDAASA